MVIQLVGRRHQLWNFTGSSEILMFHEVKIIHRFCSSKGIFESVKVHLTPEIFSARDETVQHSHKEFHNFLSVSGIFKGFKNWQKVAEICYQLVRDRVSRGLALFWIWRHRLIYMALTLCEHAYKTVCDVKSRIDPYPSPVRSWDKQYQISGCTVARKNFRCCEKMLSRFWNSFKFTFLRK